MNIQNLSPNLRSSELVCENHSTISHLFIHPFCPFQTQAKKIIALFTSIITVGIPAAINFFYVLISKKRMLSLATSIRSIEGFPLINEEALQFVKQSLLEHPTISPTYIGENWGPSMYQPTNAAIPKLISLYNLHQKELEKIINKKLGQSSENPWNSKEAQKAADSLMKTSYVVSILTLQDMPSFTKYLAKRGIQRTSYQALIEQDSYAYRSFFYCSLSYHLIREGYLFPIKRSESRSLETKQPRDEYFEHAKKFYQSETTQKQWTDLYNNFCQAVSPTVKNGRDNRFENWSKEDLSEDSFEPTPDTLPT